MKYTIEVSEEDRQMILLALSDESIDKPGFAWFIGQIADKFPDGRRMLDTFREIRGFPSVEV